MHAICLLKLRGYLRLGSQHSVTGDLRLGSQPWVTGDCSVPYPNHAGHACSGTVSSSSEELVGGGRLAAGGVACAPRAPASLGRADGGGMASAHVRAT